MWILLAAIEPMTPGRTVAFLFAFVIAWLVYSFLYVVVDRLVERFAELVALVRDSSPYADELRRRPDWVGFDHHELVARGRVTRIP